MKRTLLFILAFLPMLASADPVEIGGICYNLVEETKEAEVSPDPNNYNIVDLTIPESVEYEGVTYNVTSIGSKAFYYCTGLKSVTISKYVATIGNQAFNSCKNLTSVTFANGVTSIGDCAFNFCTSLKSVTIPSSVTDIGETVFLGCYGLQSIVVEKGNTVYDSREDCNAIIKTSDNELVIGCMNTTIPNSVTAISSWAFFNCTGLTSINIPNSVTKIGQSAFEGCLNLVSINIPNSVTEINGQTFAHCEALTSVSIPNGVTTIGDQAFSGCIGLTSITIGSGVKSIGLLAFTDCMGLLDVYCYAEEVPETQNEIFEVFQYANIENVTLHVPAASISAYQAVEPWKNFKEIVALKDQDSNIDDSDYLPFVEEGKEWHVVRSEANQGYHFDKYMLPQNATLIDDETGKTYYIMYKSEDDKEESNIVGIFREEDRKVYYIESNPQTYIMPKENLLFDYSLKAGDTYETYSYDEEKMVTYKVLSVDDYTEGPQVRLKKYDEKTGNMITHSRYLRKWTVCRTDDNSIQKTWIEGVGSLGGPLANLYNDSPISTCSNLAYVLVNVESEGFIVQFLPFSFYDMYNQVHGSGLSAAADQSSTDWDEQFTFELEGNLLHVHGKTYLNCGCNHYAYFFEEQTEDPFVRKLHFQIQREGVEATCYSFAILDFYVPGFYPEINYTVVDEYGEEYPVFNKMAYRPMIEEGKVWKVGSTAGISDGIVKVVEYYYFDGDTIIDGKTCKQMMCQRYVSPDYPDYDYWSQSPSLSKVGAWYEEDKKVYLYNEKTQSVKILYDFSLDENDIIYFLVEGGYQPYLGPKQTGGIEGFKGVYRDVLMGNNVYNTTWLEGVGGIEGPTFNAYQGKIYNPWLVISCSVGDEVIYLNDEYEDGATPWEMDAKKHRFDFTHTIKTKPQTRSEAAEEKQPLYGEYSDQLLDINLDPLDEAYLVRITNESDKVVYEKTINAGNIVALNIDISAFAKGRYTVTMENSGEVFTGEFETITTGIQELINEEETKIFNSSTLQFFNSIYNLQGQRLNRLQKGLNIVNGRKVLVK